MEFPINNEETAYFDPNNTDLTASITTVSGDEERGQEILYKIQEKAHTYMEKYRREPKYMILDSQSYLDLLGYSSHLTRYSSNAEFYQTGIIYTSVGPLTPIVLPQIKRRIQVIGDDPMFTAIQTLSENR